MRVDESKQRDVGKRRARIGPDAMDYLHVAPGDIIEIVGNQTSCAIVWPSDCLLYTSPSPRDISGSRMPSSA